jgi:hypothetical protein
MATQVSERDPDVVTYAAFNGLRNDVTAERFDIGDLAVADNIDIDKTGRVARRAGYASVSASAAHSLWADRQEEICMCVRGGNLLRVAGDYSTTIVKALDNSAERMAFERVSDRIYFSNGTDVGIYENNAARDWGLPQATLPGAVVTSGNMPAGKYQFSMTFLRADGQESGAPMCGVIELPASGGLVFTLPVSTHPDVVGKILYLSPPNAETAMEAAAVANSVTSLTWLSDPSALSEPLDKQFLQPAPAGQLIAFYRGHMFVAVGDTLYISQPYAYELFDLRRYLQLDGRITLLAPFSGRDRSDGPSRDSGFFVGTDRTCGAIAGTDTSSFQYIPKTSYGAIFGALDYVDGTLFHQGETGARQLPIWLTTQGICVGMPDLLINNLTRAKFTFPAAGRGAALFMPGPKRFIATANL